MPSPPEIRVLDEVTASRIAAGEVIERPANVVKELIENSLDAGADEIRIEIREGGRRQISVSDNGHGIPAAQVGLAFEPHATSKITSASDLERVATLGFRGEALTSIAAVSQVTLLTRAAPEETGTRVRLEGGRIVHQEMIGAPPGTSVAVENLFHALPARLKFLRTEATESARIRSVVTRYALAYPEVRFALVHGGREVFRSDGTGRTSALRAVFGSEAAAEMLVLGAEVGAEVGDSSAEMVEPEEALASGGSIEVTGYASPPHLHRATRRHITLLVNGRWVQDSSLTYAVVQAYHTLLPTGRFPLAVIIVAMPPEQIDCNVHPSKTEVRFRDPRAVFSAVQRVVRRAVVGGAPVPRLGLADGSRSYYSPERTAQVTSGPALVARPGPPVERPLEERQEALPVLRVLGQIGRTYILAEGPDGLYLIDQHAAHERVMYERMRDQQRAPGVQKLLSPQQVRIRPEEMAELERSVGEFSKLGFEIEPFGSDTALVRALPEGIAASDVGELVAGVLDEALAGGNLLEDAFEERLIRAVCKKATIKGGQRLSHEEMTELIRALEDAQSPRTCPHGRPTMIVLTFRELEASFGRH